MNYPRPSSPSLVDLISEVQQVGQPVRLLMPVQQGSARALVWELGPQGLFAMYRLQVARDLQRHQGLVQLALPSPPHWVSDDPSSRAEYQWLCCNDDGFFIKACDGAGQCVGQTTSFSVDDLCSAFEAREADEDYQWMAHGFVSPEDQHHAVLACRDYFGYFAQGEAAAQPARMRG